MTHYTHVKINGKVIALKQFTNFCVTGTLYNDRRFKPIVYSEFYWANGINLYNGSVWGVKPDGKRVLLKRVYD